MLGGPDTALRIVSPLEEGFIQIDPSQAKSSIVLDGVFNLKRNI